MFDEAAKDSAWKNLVIANSLQILSDLRKARPIYQEYLKSAAWRAKRNLVLKRASGICEGCGVNPATQVHHFSYDNLGDELLWELAAVCDTCHDRSHPWKLDDNGSYADMMRQRLHRQIENSPLFREEINAKINIDARSIK